MEVDMVYEPREDSYCLAEQVKKYAFGDCLDVGTGSGIQAKSAALSKQVDSVIAVDLNPKALAYAKENNDDDKIKFIESNLYSKLGNKKFDTIIFNPPYLPNDPRVKDIALDGGIRGYELTERFLDLTNQHLKEDGIILLLFSSYTDINKINEIIMKNMFTYEKISTEKLDHEELYVYKIKKCSCLKDIEKKGVKNLTFFNKGKRGFIFTGRYKGKDIAIKILRPDTAAVKAIQKEIEALQFLKKNKIENIPQIIFSGENYFAYYFIQGINIEEFLITETKSNIKQMILDVLKIMYKLDKFGYNKEEMHNPHKHIIMKKEGKKYISSLIDFERLKQTKSPKNVTQFCQFITSTNFTKNISEKNISIEREILIEYCQKYKKNMDEIYKKIIDYVKSL